MIAPPIPTDEPERLATLRSLGLLETDAEGYAIVAGSAPLRNPQGPIAGAVLLFREA